MKTFPMAASVLSFASALPFLGAALLLPTAGIAQTDPDLLERLRRDQDEILRKAERLQALMQRLEQRYEREGKKEQVQLLKDGQAHLQRSGILGDVASIRDDLAATALTEALRKQKDVVEDLERLLNILLERKSVEQLDQQMQLATEQAATARELERRQRELIAETREALKNDTSPAQKALLDKLAELQAAERREAERNARQAGTRRPFLESALERVRSMLRDQERLEASAKDEAAGRTTAVREREFDLGSMAQRTRELERQLRDQQSQDALAEAAKALREEAAGSDPQALQQARDRFQALVQDAPKQPGGPEGAARDPKWDELREQMEKAPAGATPAERAELQKLATAAEELGKQRSGEAAQRNADESGRLASEGQKLAERLQASEPAVAPDNEAAKAKSAAAAVEEAGKKLAEAEAAERKGDVAGAREKTNQATAALERARSNHQQQNPDAAKKAGEMAAEAQSTAQELRNAPRAEDAEKTASEQLEAAAAELRKTQETLEAAREQNQRPDTQQATAASRDALQKAQQALQEALEAANQDGKEDLQAAAERQQQLQAAAKAAAEQMQKAASSGQVNEAQQQKAGEQLAKAQQRMQDAAQKLQSGQQASAAGAQQEAADALQKAADELQKNQPLTEQQQQALRDKAAAQKELEEDIVRLAEELKKRQNKNAQRAAEQAADAAKKAQRAMEQGDQEETDEQQQEAREKLQQAAEQLEEEKDRYQDLRQEELLFRMREELTTFLEKQRPITAQTLEAQQTAPPEGLSRPARRKLNQLGEQEKELAGKLDFLVGALTEEGNLVYQSVLKANLDDLREVERRLGGRAPDPGTYTTMLQQDVERRSEDLLKALERERQRRNQERREQQEQQGQGQNKMNQQRQKLVSLIAELEMLKQLGLDTKRANDNLRTLVESRGDEATTDAETQMIERLAHRHSEISKLFAAIKQGVEQSMQAMSEPEGTEEEGGRGR